MSYDIFVVKRSLYRCRHNSCAIGGQFTPVNLDYQTFDCFRTFSDGITDLPIYPVTKSDKRVFIR